MTTSKQPIFMIGGLNVSLVSVKEYIDRKIPYLLVGCHNIESENKKNKREVKTYGNLDDELKIAFQRVLK